MKYSWASITKSCINQGNFLIEEALLSQLKKIGVDKPNLVFDAFQPQRTDMIEKIINTKFVIIPGCTTFTLSDYPAIDQIVGENNVRLFNIGACFMKKPDEKFISKIRHFYQPIGTRDPISDNFLKKNNIKSELIGCPTLFSGNAKSFEKKQPEKILFVIGLKEVNEQKKLLFKISKLYEIEIIVQQQDQIEEFPGLEVSLYNNQNILEKISSAQLIITGRLHTALPALAMGKPVVFLRIFEDSRFSLLEYIGLKQFCLEEAENLFEKQINYDWLNDKLIYNNIRILKQRFQNYLLRVKSELN